MIIYEVFVKGYSKVGKRTIDRFVGAYDTLDKAKYHAQEINKLLRDDLCGIALDLAEWRIDIRNSDTFNNDLTILDSDKDEFVGE